MVVWLCLTRNRGNLLRLYRRNRGKLLRLPFLACSPLDVGTASPSHLPRGFRGWVNTALLSRFTTEIMPVFVSGNIHQGHEMFGNESRGRQCAFMALNSILYEQISPVSAWTSQTLDAILVKLVTDENVLVSASQSTHP